MNFMQSLGTKIIVYSKIKYLHTLYDKIKLIKHWSRYPLEFGIVVYTYNYWPLH